MRVRLTDRVRLRDDFFGGICYVPHRDDFFAVRGNVYRLLRTLTPDWTLVAPGYEKAFVPLCRLGICKSTEPEHEELAYSGPSFIGEFAEIPAVSDPLVLNCFATSHCPLKCVYCHADDLMQEFRDDETDRDLDNVVATAQMVPAIVAVITGGDPLTRPHRAAYLIERLAVSKALVLDTSGVGDIRPLLALLVRHSVHVRVSLDAVSPLNDQVRPVNVAYASPSSSSTGARGTIEACLAAGLSVTVQTVISARNENEQEWADLREWLIAVGIKNWVIHVAVKGGSARRIEKAKARQKRGRGILPSGTVYGKLAHLIEDTQSCRLPIDIRCTDTDNTPNSVLLVNSKGDLFTEGYAHDGKVKLYSAGSGRPDLVRASWFHLDRFGHARRYLNWHPWLSKGLSLERLCINVPLPSLPSGRTATVVESEAKYWVESERALTELLEQEGFVASERRLQRDEYYDTDEQSLAGLDFVVRLRLEAGVARVGLKGPRFYAATGEYSRIELEVSVDSPETLRSELHNRGLSQTWCFEKRRTQYRNPGNGVLVAVDEIPEVGYFAEIEGELDQVRVTATVLAPALGLQDSRNYRDIFIAFKESQGHTATITRAEFA